MRIGYSVSGFDQVAHYGKARFRLRRISVAVEKCEWKKQHSSGSSEEPFDLLFDVIEVIATVNSGVAN
jgi:hypothetical protein